MVGESHSEPLFPKELASNRPLWMIGGVEKLPYKKNIAHWTDRSFKMPTMSLISLNSSVLFSRGSPLRLPRVINTSGAFWAIQPALWYRAWPVLTKCSAGEVCAQEGREERTVEGRAVEMQGPKKLWTKEKD